LMARLRAALRHAFQAQGELAVFVSGDLAVDLVRRHVTRGGHEVKLSPKEFDLLRHLVMHAGKVLTHRHLLREVWGPAQADEVQYLRVFIRGLRHKLEPDPTRPTHILTELGVGYRLQLPPEQRAGGVVAFSSGNHAQGVAAAARLLGMRCVIVMPHDAPRAKRERTAALGAEVVLYDRARDDREAIAKDIAERRGAVLVPPYDDALIIAGQGTAGDGIAGGEDSRRRRVCFCRRRVQLGGSARPEEPHRPFPRGMVLAARCDRELLRRTFVRCTRCRRLARDLLRDGHGHYLEHDRGWSDRADLVA